MISRYSEDAAAGHARPIITLGIGFTPPAGQRSDRTAARPSPAKGETPIIAPILGGSPAVDHRGASSVVWLAPVGCS
jgi:hypothetical protein